MTEQPQDEVKQVDEQPQRDFKEVDKLYKKAQSFQSGGFFHSKDADKAEKLFNQAMKLIRGIRPATEQSVEWQLKILEGLAAVRYAMHFFLDAAKALSEAFRIAKDGIKNFNKKYPKIHQYCKESAKYYCMNKNYEKAADILLDCAKFLFETDIDESIELLDQACSIEETHEREHLCHKYFDAAAKYTLKAKKYKKAIEFLEREIIQYETVLEKRIERIWRNVTGIVLIHYYLGNLDVAEIRYDKALEKYQQLSSDVKQADLCKEFLDIFGKNDQIGLDKIKKSEDLNKCLPGYMVTFICGLTLLNRKFKEN